MTTMTITDARKNLFALVGLVNDGEQAVEIVSKHGNAVLISLSEYESLRETLDILSDPITRAALTEPDDALIPDKVVRGHAS